MAAGLVLLGLLGLGLVVLGLLVLLVVLVLVVLGLLVVLVVLVMLVVVVLVMLVLLVLFSLLVLVVLVLILGFFISQLLLSLCPFPGLLGSCSFPLLGIPRNPILGFTMSVPAARSKPGPSGAHSCGVVVPRAPRLCFRDLGLSRCLGFIFFWKYLTNIWDQVLE